MVALHLNHCTSKLLLCSYCSYFHKQQQQQYQQQTDQKKKKGQKNQAMSLEQFTQMKTSSTVNEQAQAKNSNCVLSGLSIIKYHFQQQIMQIWEEN